MKTAEEIIEQNFTNIFDHSQKVIIKSLMKEYALEACKEQRKICAENMGTKSAFYVALSSKQPQLK